MKSSGRTKERRLVAVAAGAGPAAAAADCRFAALGDQPAAAMAVCCMRLAEPIVIDNSRTGFDLDR